eukprot:403357989
MQNVSYINEIDYFLHYLWKKPTSKQLVQPIKFNFILPDTVIYQQVLPPVNPYILLLVVYLLNQILKQIVNNSLSKPVNWYFSSSDAHILKKKQGSMSQELLIDNFLKQKDFDAPVAVAFKYIDALDHRNYSAKNQEGSKKTIIERDLITTQKFRTYIAFQKKNEISCIQKFVQSKGPNYSIIRCFWTLNSIRLEKVSNINQKQNKYLSIYQRYLTIEERHRFYQIEPVISNLVQQDIIVACNLIQAQFQLHMIPLQQCTYYFTLDQNDSLNFLFPTHIKLLSTNNYLYYDSQLAFPLEYMNLINSFNRRSTVNVSQEDLHKYLKLIQIEQTDALDLTVQNISKKICPFCQTQLYNNNSQLAQDSSLREDRIDIKRINSDLNQNFALSVRELEKTRSGININDLMARSQSHIQQQTGFYEFTVKNLMKLQNQQQFLKSVAQLSKIQEKSLRSNHKIPPIIRILFPQLNENQYLMKEHDLQWQYKTFQTCQNCFTKISEKLEQQDREDFIINDIESQTQNRRYGVDFLNEDMPRAQQNRYSMRRASRSGHGNRFNPDLSIDFNAQRQKSQSHLFQKKRPLNNVNQNSEIFNQTLNMEAEDASLRGKTGIISNLDQSYLNETRSSFQANRSFIKGNSSYSHGVMITSLADTDRRNSRRRKRRPNLKETDKPDHQSLVNFTQEFANAFQRNKTPENRYKNTLNSTGEMDEATKLLVGENLFNSQYDNRNIKLENQEQESNLPSQRVISNPFLKRLSVNDNIIQTERLNNKRPSTFQIDNNPLQQLAYPPKAHLKKRRNSAVQKIIELTKQNYNQLKSQPSLLANQSQDRLNSQNITLNNTQLQNINIEWLNKNYSDLRSARELILMDINQQYKQVQVKTDREQQTENLLNYGFKAKTIDLFRKSLQQGEIGRQAKQILKQMKIKRYYRDQQVKIQQCESLSSRMGTILKSEEIQSIVRGNNDKSFINGGFEEEQQKEKFNNTQQLLGSINKNLDSVMTLLNKKDKDLTAELLKSNK